MTDCCFKNSWHLCQDCVRLTGPLNHVRQEYLGPCSATQIILINAKEKQTQSPKTSYHYKFQNWGARDRRTQKQTAHVVHDNTRKLISLILRLCSLGDKWIHESTIMHMSLDMVWKLV